MMFLAAASDVLGFGVTLILSVSIPAVGLIVSSATINRRGLNPWAGASSIAFFLTLLVTSVMLVLGSSSGVNEKVVLYVIIGCGVMHTISALMALRALAQVRSRRKWAYGRQRAYWIFGMNILILLIMSVWCFYYVFEPLNKALQLRQ